MCALHGVRSDAVFAIAMCGRPENARPAGSRAHPGPVEIRVAMIALRTTVRFEVRDPTYPAETIKGQGGAGERPA